MDKVKPCLCGNKYFIYNIPDPEEHDDLPFIECPNCLYSTGYQNTEKEAIAIWNRRHV